MMLKFGVLLLGFSMEEVPIMANPLRVPPIIEVERVVFSTPPIKQTGEPSLFVDCRKCSDKCICGCHLGWKCQCMETIHTVVPNFIPTQRQQNQLDVFVGHQLQIPPVSSTPTLSTSPFTYFSAPANVSGENFNGRKC